MCSFYDPLVTWGLMVAFFVFTVHSISIVDSFLVFSCLTSSLFSRFKSDKAAYEARVRQDVLSSKERLYDIDTSKNSYTSDPHYIRFSQFDPEIHGNVLAVKVSKALTL